MHPVCLPGEGCSRSTMFTQLVQTPIHRLTPEALPLWFCGRTSRDVWSCARTDWTHRRMCACCRQGVGLAHRRAARHQWSTAASLGGVRVGDLHCACCLRSRRARVRLPALRAANEARPRSARLVCSHKFRGWRRTFIAPLALRSLAGGGGAALSLRARRFACALRVGSAQQLACNEPLSMLVLQRATIEALRSPLESGLLWRNLSDHCGLVTNNISGVERNRHRAGNAG